MQKKTIFKSLFGIAAAALMSACGNTDLTDNNLQENAEPLPEGAISIQNMATCGMHPVDNGFNIICDGKIIGTLNNGKDGQDGKDGTDGKDGSGCSLAELDEGLGYHVTCGDNVGIILNGKNGKNGDGCTMSNDPTGVGAYLVCGDQAVLIKHGENGADGKDGKDGLDGKDGINGADGISCYAEPYEDENASGFNLYCADTLVGTILNGKNGKDGVSSTDTLFISSKDTTMVSRIDTIIVSQKDTIVSIIKDTTVIKDTVVVKDTVVLSHKDTVFFYPESGSSNETVTSNSESIWNNASYIIDSRDNQQYRIVTIGSQTWMAENLRYEENLSGDSYCYEDLEESCEKTGRLYTWDAVMNGESEEETQGICPDNWHIPSSDEWNILYSYVKGNRFSVQDYSWNNGKDQYGFSAKISGQYQKTASEYNPAGYSNGWDASYERGYSASFWTSTVSSTSDAIQWYIYESFNGEDGEWSYASAGKKTAFAVRCIRNSKIEVNAAQPQKIVVYDDTEETVKIGTQIWMTKNVADAVNWTTAMDISSEYASASATEVVNAKQQGVCPDGFHIPHNSEWFFLRNYIEATNEGLESVAASLMDDTSWPAVNNASNSYKFFALPIGSASMGFDGDLRETNATYFWSATEDYEERHAHYFSLVSGGATLVQHHNNYNKTLKFSVRCIKD